MKTTTQRNLGLLSSFVPDATRCNILQRDSGPLSLRTSAVEPKIGFTKRSQFGLTFQ
jgi:hypothetical protein